MGILFFIIFGFIVGLVARAVMPGRQSMGFIATSLLGMVGSFIGGMIGSMLAREPVTVFHTAGILGSIIGALVVLAVAGALRRRRVA